jgi:hypothetical protein
MIGVVSFMGFRVSLGYVQSRALALGQPPISPVVALCRGLSFRNRGPRVARVLSPPKIVRNSANALFGVVTGGCVDSLAAISKILFFRSDLSIGLRISLVAELALDESMDCGAGALASASARKEFGRLLTSCRMEVWLDIRDLSDVGPAGDCKS